MTTSKTTSIINKYKHNKAEQTTRKLPIAGILNIVKKLQHMSSK